MHDWVDYTAVITSWIAIWYTIRESKHNNSVVLKLRHCAASGHWNAGENKGEAFNSLSILVENRGLSLYDLQASIRFSGFDGTGSFNFQLVNRGKKKGGEFAKGMVAEFGIKSYEFTPA